MGRSRKNAKAPSRAKRLRNASKETAAKQQYRAIHLDVREHENAARRAASQHAPWACRSPRINPPAAAGRRPPTDHFIPIWPATNLLLYL
jgi:hypothetical protein